VPYCESCGEEIGYLPFKCKYCGGTFCKKHRLPENHDCSFEIKHTPVVPISSEPGSDEYPGASLRGRVYTDKEYKKDKAMKEYLKQQKKQKERTYGRYRYPSLFSGTGETKGTNYIIIAIVAFSIAALFLPLYLCLSIYGLLQLYLWIILTSMFISYSSDFVGLFFLLILIFFLYNISKTIEQRFGTRFLVNLYAFCAAFTALFYILIRLALSSLYPINSTNIVFIGLATGSILGLISFIVYFNPNNEMFLFCFFIPVKMKGKTLLIVLILFRLLPGLLFGLIVHPLYFAVYLPDLGGILGSYLVFYSRFKQRNF
jgi:hypothetical protein